MGVNVSLTPVVTGTTISSAAYNTSLNALNTANTYTFTRGSLSQIVTFAGAGFGTITPGITSPGGNINGANCEYSVSLDLNAWNLACKSFGTTTFSVSANSGSTYIGTAWKD